MLSLFVAVVCCSYSREREERKEEGRGRRTRRIERLPR